MFGPWSDSASGATAGPPPMADGPLQATQYDRTTSSEWTWVAVSELFVGGVAVCVGCLPLVRGGEMLRRVQAQLFVRALKEKKTDSLFQGTFNATDWSTYWVRPNQQLPPQGLGALPIVKATAFHLCIELSTRPPSIASRRVMRTTEMYESVKSHLVNMLTRVLAEMVDPDIRTYLDGATSAFEQTTYRAFLGAVVARVRADRSIISQDVRRGRLEESAGKVVRVLTKIAEHVMAAAPALTEDTWKYRTPNNVRRLDPIKGGGGPRPQDQDAGFYAQLTRQQDGVSVKKQAAFWPSRRLNNKLVSVVALKPGGTRYPHGEPKSVKEMAIEAIEMVRGWEEDYLAEVREAQRAAAMEAGDSFHSEDVELRQCGGGRRGPTGWQIRGRRRIGFGSTNRGLTCLCLPSTTVMGTGMAEKVQAGTRRT
ncbi:unnamed protein product [Vitrella brassicaformis CCMP3155]|uniref:Uncharacterized protein n=1 Tax=Vitrella brassicaformis (strain CCMP3155) TaxID=1169540 RepID=A0A0G4FGS4_VITBC|nr:unnamed protein product [Vitrella brassicaformis CCMP3155]|eukprot:CEM12700.1 unnamed protein product [Vitrella brassicaformis CCMP3155]